MNSELIKRTRRLAAALTAAAAAAGLWSCESIYDYEGDCAPHWQVKFIYDMNMNFADAFPGPMGVGSVHLYVFDAATHRLVLEKEETAGAEGFAEGYTMPVEELPMGRYDFVAWCGLADNRSFVGAASAGTAPERYDGTAQAWRVADGITVSSDADAAPEADAARRLDPLYYGRTGNFEIYDQQGTHIVPVHLTKDTNEFTVIIQHKSKAIDPNDFEIEISDRNTCLLWNNDGISPENKDYCYRPYAVARGTAQDLKDIMGVEPVENNIVIWHLSSSRLLSGHNPILTIRDKRPGWEKKVFEMPLLQYLLMEGEYRSRVRDAHNQLYKWKDDQEYLDREDSWNMHFILDDNLSEQGGWYALELHILSWHVILMNTDLGAQ